MKQIIFGLCLIYLASCSLTSHEKKLGPAHNIEDRGEDVPSCEERYAYKGDGEWLDSEIIGLSDCVDLHLYSQNKSRYYDKCCYVRFQLDGDMHHGCIGLTQEQLIDTTETIRRMEEGDRTIWSSAATNSKIYQLDCGATYLKFISLAVVLISLLF